MIYASILHETPTALHIFVAAGRGDARQFGVCGKHWIRKRGITVTKRALGPLARIDLPAETLEYLGRQSDPLSIQS